MSRKNIWALILCGLLLLNTNIVVSANNREDVGEKLRNRYEQIQEKYNVDEEEIQQQNELSKKYNEIEQRMKKGQCQTEKIYDDCYGGAYIDDDILVVCITDEEIEEYADENVEYKIVDYSYNDLLDIQKTLEDAYVEFYDKYSQDDKEFELLDSIAGIGIDEINNRVIVDIVGLTDYKEIIFQELFGSYGCVELEDVKQKAERCNTYKAGKEIVVITGSDATYIYSSTVSIGYRAYMEVNGETRYGFVTCGHGIKDSINGFVYDNSQFKTVIGEIVVSRCDGTLDASFVELINGHKMSLVVNYSDSTGTETNGDAIKKGSLISSIASGNRVYKVGSTTYKTSGIILSTNYSETIDGLKCTNLIKTTNIAKKGDSGGLVYYNDGQYNVILGIIRGANSTYSYHVKAYEIANKMKIYPY